MFVSSATRNLIICVLLAAATVAVYFPVHRQPFLNLDDNQYVTDNLHVQDGLNWPTVMWAFTSYYALNWHPLTWLSHAGDVQLFGLDPAGHHEVNLLLHVVNVLLLFWVLQRATGYAGRSAMVAALFALHPINVESVAWIAERKNLLSMLFFLLALGTWRWYAQKPGRGRYALVAAWFALGLMAKPQVITLPFVLLLWDYWPLGRLAVRPSPSALRQNSSGEISGEKRIATGDWRWLFLEKLPLFLLCIVSSVITMQAQRAGGAVASLVKYPLWVRLENALVSYARYLAKAIWPADLAPMYPHPGTSVKTWEAFAALLFLLGITMLVWDGRRYRYLLVGWLWFVGTMVPMIGIVQVGHQAMADRYAYLPFIGLFIIGCWGFSDLLVAVVSRSARHEPTLSSETRRIANVSLAIVSLVALLALAAAAHRQLQYWNDNLKLWARVSQVIGPNLLSEERSGDELLKRGQPEAAMVHFMRAVIIQPDDPDSNFAIAVYEQKHGDLSEAIQRYRVVAANAPNAGMRARALTYMGYAYRDLGDTERARESLQAAQAIGSQR